MSGKSKREMQESKVHKSSANQRELVNLAGASATQEVYEPGQHFAPAAGSGATVHLESEMPDCLMAERRNQDSGDGA